MIESLKDRKLLNEITTQLYNMKMIKMLSTKGREGIRIA